tara:strand:- start:144 stop:440 length:297 start_codon:yes stop_codon:yes gene_type:complete
MNVKPKSKEIVTPEPYYKVAFRCSNAAFYYVKQDLYGMAQDIEIEDGYISEKCDYEGDLEEIIIYNSDRSRKLIKEVARFYNLRLSEVGQMNIVLSIF